MSSRNEAAERLLQAISDKHTEDYSGIVDWDEAVVLIEQRFAAERRATVERIRARFDFDPCHECENADKAYAILDEALATPSDKATR